MKTRAELEAAAAAWAGRDPSTMTDQELVQWNAAMAELDQANAEE
jgi:DNA-binding GntR family transcriptional regulator